MKPKQLWILLFSVLNFSVAAQPVVPNFRFNTLNQAGLTPSQTNAATINDPRLNDIALRLKEMTQKLALQAGTNRQQTVQGAVSTAVADEVQVYSRKNGTPLQIKGKVMQQRIMSLPVGVDPDEATSRQFLRANKELLRIEDPDNEFVLVKREADALKRRHLRFSQHYKTLPVWPCEFIVHLEPGGSVDLADGTLIPTPAGVALQPVVAATNAVGIAMDTIENGFTIETEQPELIIYGPLEKEPKLAWKFDSTGQEAWRFVIDALNGEVLAKIKLHPDGAITGSGIDGLGVQRPLNLWESGNTNYMVDASKPMFRSSVDPIVNPLASGAIIVLSAQNTPATSNPQGPVWDQIIAATSMSTSSGWDTDAVGAAFGLSQTYDYYYQRHNRDSLNGAGATLIAIVRYGKNFPNAFYDGQSRIMYFGDGFARALDVCGHELTHGVIFNTGSNGILEYHDQSGALNEAFADIFGEMVEARTFSSADWLKGAELGAAMQNYANPGAIEFYPGRKNPSKMSEFVQPSDPILNLFQNRDGNGVHINSSIINHAFYLLAAGLDGAVGISAAEKIFYRALTVHLQKQSQFIDARLACIASAEELFGTGSTEAQKTREAFNAVEITDAPAQSSPGSIPAVQAPDSTLALRWSSAVQDYYLVRRESAKSDSSVGTFINTPFLRTRHLSVAGNGSLASFVTADSDFGLIDTSTGAYDTMGRTGEVYTAVLAPNTNTFAFVLMNESGIPTNVIKIIDLAERTVRSIKITAPTVDGQPIDIVQYVNAMDFSADSSLLVLDAYCRVPTSAGYAFGGWTIFALDLKTEAVVMLVPPDERYDFGNPSMGNTRKNLLAFDVFDNETESSTVVTADLFSGKIGAIANSAMVGVPCYNGDDTAVIYSYPDSSVISYASLARQPLAADRITPSGIATQWLADANFGVIYRRGAFNMTNRVPTVSVTSPTQNKIFGFPASISIQASVADADGTISKVQFYDGSIKIAEKTTAPYSLTWTNAAVGSHRLVARAIDNLGGTKDSAPVTISVATCGYTLASNSAFLNFSGGTGSVSVTAVGNCPWKTVNTNSWITITAGANAAGSGKVSFTVAANNSATPRTGYLTVAGKTFAVAQGAQFSPPSLRGKTIMLTITSGSGTLPASGKYMVVTSSGTNNTLQIVPLSGTTPALNATYIFARSNASICSISYPGTTNSFTFTGATKGTFSVKKSDGSRQSGTFVVENKTTDLNGDARADLLWQNTTNGALSFWLMQGTNYVRSVSLRNGTVPPTGWRACGSADFNNDGQGDVLFQTSTGSLALWLMNKTNWISTVSLRNGTAAASGWRALSAVDFNGDGQPDVLFQHDDGRLAFWMFNGTNYVSNPALGGKLSAGITWRAAAATDLNGDRQPDILFQNAAGSTMAWLMNATTGIGVVNLVTLNSGWQIAGAGDFNLDGVNDILVQNSGGAATVLLMNGVSYLTSFSLRNGANASAGYKCVSPK